MQAVDHVLELVLQLADALPPNSATAGHLRHAACVYLVGQVQVGVEEVQLMRIGLYSLSDRLLWFLGFSLLLVLSIIPFLFCLILSFFRLLILYNSVISFLINLFFRIFILLFLRLLVLFLCSFLCLFRINTLFDSRILVF